MAIIIGAAFALAVMDAFVLTVAFIYRPAGFWIAAGICTALVAAAAVLRSAWLAFVAQAIVSTIVLYRVYEYSLLPAAQRGDGSVTRLIVPLATIVLGTGLAWLIVRVTADHKGEATKESYSVDR